MNMYHTLLLRSLVTCRYQYYEIINEISEQLVSALQNFKLVGGDINPDILIFREQHTNAQLGKKEVKELVEDKLMGILLLESANDKKYGDFQRLLQNNMSQGHNYYPINKSVAYTMLSKFLLEKKNPSNTNKDRTRDTSAANVSFYQQREPVDGTPISGTYRTVKI